MMCRSLIIRKKFNVGKQLWYTMNKTLLDMLVLENDQLWGGNNSPLHPSKTGQSSYVLMFRVSSLKDLLFSPSLCFSHLSLYLSILN